MSKKEKEKKKFQSFKGFGQKEEAVSEEAINPEEQPAMTEGEEPAPAPAAEEVQAEPTELEMAIAAAEDFKRKWYAVTAEYENYRKRTAASVSNAYRDGASDAVLKLLPVSDTFGYAYDSAQDEKTKEGIDKVMKSFATILQSMGIEEIAIKPGDPFDETVAEAVMNIPCEDGEVPHTVKFILKKGYRSGEKVIRYAQVAVTV